MVPTNGASNGVATTNGRSKASYSMEAETRKSLSSVLQLAKTQIPAECRDIIASATFTTANTGSPYFPCPFKETEATSALKAVEAGMAAAIANLIYGEKERKITVDLDRASSFLFSAYLSTVDGMNKAHPNVKSKLKGWCFNTVVEAMTNISKIPISYKRSLSFIEDSPPICTKPRTPANTSICTALWKRLLR